MPLWLVTLTPSYPGGVAHQRTFVVDRESRAEAAERASAEVTGDGEMWPHDRRSELLERALGLNLEVLS